MAELGRPTQLNDEVRRKIEEAAALGASVEEMAYYSGVHRATLYNWLKDDKDFFDRITELQEKPILKARQTVITDLATPSGARWYLEKKKNKEFGNKIDVTSGGDKIGEPSEDIKNLTAQINELYRTGGGPAGGILQSADKTITVRSDAAEDVRGAPPASGRHE